MTRAAVAVVLAAVGCIAQVQAAAPTAVPKIEGPNFSGTWEDPFPPEILRPAGSPRPPQEVPPAPLKEPWASQVRALQQEQAAATARGETAVNGGVRCLPGGFPSMMKAVFPVEVLQSPGQVTIIQEAFGQVRRIYLNEKQIAVEDAEPLFWGHSVGRWEGNTLVVNTIGLKENVRMAGVPHSANMRIDERITVTSPENWEDQITITDPEFLTKPWTFTYKYNRMKNYHINEFVCEDNRIYEDAATGKAKLRLGE
ncbi:MAG: hypothetical protein ABIP38_05360 [Steroidobacteraceae bacterium]